MNLTLTRKQYRADGIFSELTDPNGNVIAQTLEHAFPESGDSWEPKIPNGTYICIKGQHQLLSMTKPFTTYEITGVTGHTNLLFHMGNFDENSEGCILLGESLAYDSDRKEQMVTHSDATFAAFMEMQNGIDSFTLTVAG